MSNAKRESKRETERNRLPNKSLAVLAMLQSGYAMNLIADILGLSVTDVQAIDKADDEHIRCVIREGLPEEFLDRIRRAIKCRICGGRINLVPCVLCR